MFKWANIKKGIKTFITMEASILRFNIRYFDKKFSLPTPLDQGNELKVPLRTLLAGCCLLSDSRGEGKGLEGEKELYSQWFMNFK